MPKRPPLMVHNWKPNPFRHRAASVWRHLRRRGYRPILKWWQYDRGACVIDAVRHPRIRRVCWEMMDGPRPWSYRDRISEARWRRIEIRVLERYAASLYETTADRCLSARGIKRPSQEECYAC